MSENLRETYNAFYKKRDPIHVYPVEFVVRAFLGSYPRLQNAGVKYSGLDILDLGFGDGRNVPLLANLGFEVFGVEISPEICEFAVERLKKGGFELQAKVGRNSLIPFQDGRFDHVLACHACYYVDPGESFEDNIAEISRVLKEGGRFTFSVPMTTSYIFEGAVDLGGGHMEIRQDPYGVRNGYVLKSFASRDEIVEALEGKFHNFRIGNCKNDFWGIEEHVWTVVCDRLGKI